MAKAGTGKRWVIAVGVAVVALSSFMVFSGGCKKQESASEKAGREAREAFEKSRELLKEGLQKGGEAAKEGLEKTQEAAKDFQKGWKDGGKQPAKP